VSVGGLELLWLAAPTVGPLLLLPWLLWWCSRWVIQSAFLTSHAPSTAVISNSSATTSAQFATATAAAAVAAAAAAAQIVCCTLWWLCQLSGLQQHSLGPIARTAAVHTYVEAVVWVWGVAPGPHLSWAARQLQSTTQLLPSQLSPSAWAAASYLMVLVAAPLAAAVVYSMCHMFSILLCGASQLTQQDNSSSSSRSGNHGSTDSTSTSDNCRSSNCSGGGPKSTQEGRGAEAHAGGLWGGSQKSTDRSTCDKGRSSWSSIRKDCSSSRRSRVTSRVRSPPPRVPTHPCSPVPPKQKTWAYFCMSTLSYMIVVPAAVVCLYAAQLQASPVTEWPTHALALPVRLLLPRVVYALAAVSVLCLMLATAVARLSCQLSPACGARHTGTSAQLPQCSQQQQSGEAGAVMGGNNGDSRGGKGQEQPPQHSRDRGASVRVESLPQAQLSQSQLSQPAPCQQQRQLGLSELDGAANGATVAPAVLVAPVTMLRQRQLICFELDGAAIGVTIAPAVRVAVLQWLGTVLVAPVTMLLGSKGPLVVSA